MATELSGILDHVERISSSISTMSSRRRTWSRSRTCCGPTSRGRAGRRERILEQAPDPADGAFRVPSRRPDICPRERLLELTVAQAAERIAGGELGGREYSGAYRAAARVIAERVPVAAEQAPTRRQGEPLAGIPVAVKDIFCTEGIPTTAGSRILEGYLPPYTATAVAGCARPVARCSARPTWTSSRWAPPTRTRATGPCSTRGTPSRVPGGSSGGSAAAVAGRLAPCAIGTDTGGSIRQPAALCGIVGLKPTYGAVSRYGMIAFASSLDQCGPLTRNVTDAALLLSTMQGRDPCDSTSVGIEGGVRRRPAARTSRASASASPRSSRARPRASSRVCARCSSDGWR